MKTFKKFNMKDYKLVSTSLKTKLELTKDMTSVDPKDIEFMKEIPYLMVIGSSTYAMTHRRPDIAYLVGQVAKFIANLGQTHWLAVKHIIRYLKGTLNYCITYKVIPQSTKFLH